MSEPAKPQQDLLRLVRWSSAQVRRLQYPLGLAVATTVITFAFTFCAVLVFEKNMPHESWLGLWKRWDAIHFLDLAQHGYVRVVQGHEHLIVLLPLYPWTIRAVYLVIRNWHLAAVLVSNMCAVGAVVSLYLLTRVDFSEKAARRAVLFFVLFPTAYFLHAAYSESLFLLLTITGFYCARRQRWALCGLLGMLATGTRVPGVIILPPLALEYLQQRQFRWREIRWDCLWLALVPLGAICYLGINYRWFGDPFHFLGAQQRVWASYIRWPLPALQANWWGVVHEKPAERVVQYGGPFVSFIIAVSASVAAPFFLRPAYALYVALSFVLLFFNNFPVSSPRYLLAVFPIFILLGRLCRAEWLRDSVAFLSALFYVVCMMHFLRGWWAY